MTKLIIKHKGFWINNEGLPTANPAEAKIFFGYAEALPYTNKLSGEWKIYPRILVNGAKDA